MTGEAASRGAEKIECLDDHSGEARIRAALAADRVTR
jgi:hypothetical protein